MNAVEIRVFNETRLRNLNRRYAKVIQHPEQKEEALKIKQEIRRIEHQLAMT